MATSGTSSTPTTNPNATLNAPDVYADLLSTLKIDLTNEIKTLINKEVAELTEVIRQVKNDTAMAINDVQAKVFNGAQTLQKSVHAESKKVESLETAFNP